MTLSGIAAAAAASASAIRRLLDGAIPIGGIYHLDFETATVLTNDDWKREAAGVPRGSFLIATTLRNDNQGSSADDDELILLRVEGLGSLPNQAELVETRMDTMRAMTEQNRPAADVLDPYTQGQIQWSALDCRVLGTFYDDVVRTHPFVEWGSDIDNLYSAARYVVYKPSADTLSFVSSYPLATAEELILGVTPNRIRIGFVRYSSTRRRSRASGSDNVPVYVRVADFVSMKDRSIRHDSVGEIEHDEDHSDSCFPAFAHDGHAHWSTPF